MLQIFLFQINAVLLNFLFIKEKKHLAVFNIIIINIFEQQIKILEWFLKDCVNGVMMLKIQLLNHRKKLHFKIHLNGKVILNIKNISQFYCFLCTLDQINAGLVSRRDLFKIIKILLFKSFWPIVYAVIINTSTNMLFYCYSVSLDQSFSTFTFVCICASSGNLAGGILNCRRSSKCCSTSFHQYSPTLPPTSSTCALETTRSNQR